MAAKLPVQKTPEDRQKRVKLFRQFDPNDNKYLSLAEVDRGIVQILRIKALADAKPAIMRAFQAAKSLNTKKGCPSVGDDYIDWCEFRLLLCYLRDYFELHVMFKRIDGGDGRIDETEFARSADMLREWGAKIKDPATTFKAIDQNGGGQILFDEFCEWAIQQKLALEEADDN